MTVFSSPWWLDAVAPGAWTVVESEVPGARGRMALRKHQRRGLRVMGHPPLTPYLDPELAIESDKTESRLHKETLLVADLVDRLPPHDLCVLRFSPAVHHVLPWRWKGFYTTVTQTFIIDLDAQDADAIDASMGVGARRKLRTSRKDHIFDPDVPAGELARLTEVTMRSKGRSTGYTPETLTRAADAAVARGSGAVVGVRRRSGRLMGAALVVWDERSAYYVAGGRDPDAAAAPGYQLLRGAIDLARHHAPTFDFEGSSDPGVAQFFRGMGGRPALTVGVGRLTGRLRHLERIRGSASARVVFGG